ncbi:MAG TPA: adenylosuccinate lyase family protein [Terracidiphilus sp.]|nr:adenylosuccinate lyase family protein [Terracidiphilus sp.]
MPHNLSDAIFTTHEMRDIFSPLAQLRAMLRFEWALGCALEEHGIIAPGCSDAVASLSDTAFVDCDRLEREAVSAGNIAIPFLTQLTDALTATNLAAAGSLHFGATSQDLLDTALVLQMRDAFTVIASKLARLDRALVDQSQSHNSTVMLARTWLQAGPPTTLGLKLAATLAALRRSATRIRAAQAHMIVLQFGGAVGTLSALGDKGEAVSRSLAAKLELDEAAVPWHSHRDNIAEVAASLATLLGTLGKLAYDIALLMQTEVSEVSEASHDGKGSSSTMPHKHNPVNCAAIVAAAKRAPGLTAILLGSIIQEHERGMGSWQTEWAALPELFCLADGALTHSIDLIENLIVHRDRMRANIEATRGLPMAEAVAVALARKIGRPQAHALLRVAVESAIARQSTLAAVLKTMPEVRTHLSDAEIDELLTPENYLGSARCFVRKVTGDANS